MGDFIACYAVKPIAETLQCVDMMFMRINPSTRPLPPVWLAQWLATCAQEDKAKRLRRLEERCRAITRACCASSDEALQNLENDIRRCSSTESAGWSVPDGW
jgi:hypothetical protein